MEEGSLLKEILYAIKDTDTVQFFATANGLLDDPDVRNRIRELEWDKYVEDLWQEIQSEPEVPAKKPRCSLDENNQPSTSNNQFGGGEESTADEKAYYIWKTDTRMFKKNLAKDTTFKVKFNEQWRGEKLLDIYGKLYEMFDVLLSQARGHDADLGRVVLSHPNLNNSIVVPLQSWQNLNADAVMSEIAKVLNSNEDIDVDQDMTVTIGSIDLPKGGKGGTKLPITSLFGPGSSMKRKKSVLYVENDNNLCMAISIGLCFMKICKRVDSDTWRNLVSNEAGTTIDHMIKYRTVPKVYYGNILRKTRKKMQTDMALHLCEKAGVPTNRYLGLNDLEPFETLLNVDIYVVSSRVGNQFVRVKEDSDRSRLYLYHVDTENEKHWHGIANIQGFFQASYFCQSCLKPYKDKSLHNCLTFCDVCQHDDCPKSDNQMGCRECGRICRSRACFERHKMRKETKTSTIPPLCTTVYQCKMCRVTLQVHKRPPEKHVCHEWQCPVCSEYHVGQHLCYQRPTQSGDKGDKKFIFYDFETRQDDILCCDQGYRPSAVRCKKCVKRDLQCSECRLCQNCRDPSCGHQQHKVNFAVMQTSCKRCQKEELTPDSKCSNCGIRCSECSERRKSFYIKPPCKDTCGYREQVFQGDFAAHQFCSYITQENCKNSILIAHNAKSFDLYPVLEILIDSHSIRPDKIIYSGSKIMYMHIARKLNLTFMDSLNFLPMKLAKIPDAFGLEELSKGYFPHLFNTKTNQNYIGPYPALEFYGYSHMSSGDRKKLTEWHAEKDSEVFNFKEEMLRYCRSDVDILRRGCLEFRKIVLETTTRKTEVIQQDGSREMFSSGGVDPFDYVTIASVCMGIFKTLFLAENPEIEIIRDQESTWYDVQKNGVEEGVSIDGNWVSLYDLRKTQNVEIGRRKYTSPIAVVPSNGYTSRDNHSKASIQWLEWLMEKNRKRGTPVHIRHALNGGEYRVPGTNYRCDGFVENSDGKGTIYEFYGCVFHGCASCFPHDGFTIKHPSTNQSMEELYTMTIKREKASLNLLFCTQVFHLSCICWSL